MKNKRVFFYLFCCRMLLAGGPVFASVLPSADNGPAPVVQHLPRYSADEEAEMEEAPARTAKARHRPARHWIWFGIFLLLAAGFFYLGFAAFLLATTAETGAALFSVARWVFLGLGAGFLGWSIRKLIRAIRGKR